MRDSSPEGLTLPGYQPVEKLGPAPSFGVWVRAVQTRMDRHVLLKLLPADLAASQDYFAREIGALVRRDGVGVLRVIDEGSTGGLRYLVVDEADSHSLGELHEPLDPEEWMALGATLEDLFRWASERGEVLLPLAPEALRRLPGGAFAAADLGWLVSYGDKLPATSGEPEWVGDRARPAWNARFLAETLRRLGEALPGVPPRRWTRIAAELEADWEGDREDALVVGRFDESEADVAPRLAVPAATAVVLALALVAVVAWLTARWLDDGLPEFDGEPPAVASRGGSGSTGVPETDPSLGSGSTGGGDPAAPRAGEEARLERLDALFGRDDGGDWRIPQVLGDRQRLALLDIVAVDPASEEAEIAAWILESAGIVAHEHAWLEWAPRAASVVEKLDDGRLVDAGRELAAARSAPWDPPPELLAELDALERRQRAAEDRLLAAIRATLAEAGDAATALAALEVSEGKATARVIAGLEALRRSAIAELTVEAAVLAALAESAVGRWDEASRRLAEATPPGDLAELTERHGLWLESLAAARRSVDGLRAGLQALAADRRYRSFELERPVELPEPRGRVESVGAEQFVIKLQGLLRERAVPLRRLSEESARDLARAGGVELGRRDWALLLLFLGEMAHALELVEAGDDVPAWYGPARDALRRLRRERLARLLADGARHHDEGRFGAARDVALEISEGYTDDEIGPRRRALADWVRAFYLGLGPVAAFPGARQARVGDDGELDLRYGFGGTGALRDWRVIGDTIVEEQRDRVELEGALVLAPEGSPSLALFGDRITVTAELRARDGRAPNLNLVLASRGGEDPARGILVGLGCRPTGLRSFTAENRPQRLLPANLIGPVGALEAGVYGAVRAFSIQPKIPAERWIPFSVTSAAGRVELSWAGGRAEPLIAADVVPPDERIGSVELRSYGSRLAVREIHIRGFAADSWWRGWVEGRVAAELGR